MTCLTVAIAPLLSRSVKDLAQQYGSLISYWPDYTDKHGPILESTAVFNFVINNVYKERP